MPPTPRARMPPRATDPPRWSAVLRALREARGVTQDGWAARLGVSRATVQRWESGERAPDPGAETAILAYCAETGLFRSFDRGPLAGLGLTAEVLRQFVAEARWHVGGGQPAADPAASASGAGARERPASASLGSDSPPRDLHYGLPAPLTSFVGRKREIAAVRRLLGGTRLLTLTGTGGCGKTRLALEVAGELLWAYPHGIWLVELAALADPAPLPETVAQALSLRTTGQRPHTDLLIDTLRPRHLLLVIDNCEHLLPACAALVETLLRACPTFEVLATSREPLGIPGEAVYRVPPLAVEAPSESAVGSRETWSAGASTTAEPRLLAPSVHDTRHPTPDSRRVGDATTLFVERARQYQSDFALRSTNESAIVEICRRLDGLPLAIELAAAWLTVLPVAEIAARLDDRFRLLTNGGRTALPRHQTLRATLDWSYALLTAAERTTLQRLGAFAAGFSLDAAEAVVGLSLDRLASLVNKSLVVAEEQDGSVRYRLLETVRQYAAERLIEAGEVASVRDRHLAYYLALAEAADRSYRGPHEAAWLRQVEREHDNLRAALDWSLTRTGAALRLTAALAHFWDRRGHLHEGRRWLARALATGADAPAAERAKALHAAGWLAYIQGDYTEARTLHEQSLALHDEWGDTRGTADARNSLGRIALRQGNPIEAQAFLADALALYAKHGYLPGIASVRSALGSLALRQGNYHAARASLEASLALYRELGNRDGIADVLEDLATVAGEQGDGERQAALVEESLAVYRELGSKDGIALALGSLGMVAWTRGDHGRALTLLRESEALYREVGDRRGIARSLANQGLVALYQGNHAQAAALCREGLALYQAAGDAWALGRYLPVLAGALFAQGQSERAARLFGTAAALRERLGSPLPPAVQPAHDHAVAAVRGALGEQTFAVAWDAGCANTHEPAITGAVDAIDLS